MNANINLTGMPLTQKPLIALVAAALLAPLLSIQAATLATGLTITVPNGYANIAVDDLQVYTTAGVVRWSRTWNGQEWKFNPQWESLSQSWKNMTGSQTADTTGSAIASSSSATSGRGAASGGTASDCWVWVDEDWAPTTTGETVFIGGVALMGPMLPDRMTPFNRLMGEGDDYTPLTRVSVDYGGLCAGTVVSGNAVSVDLEAIRRVNELYLGDAGRYAFNNRSILERRAVMQLPVISAASWHSAVGNGNFNVPKVANQKGYRWIDKAGDWIDYNTQGQVIAWGDRNENPVWLVRDSAGIVHGAVDANGRVIFSLYYNDARLIREVRDFATSSDDLPSRTVKYEYDDKNRLTKVTDARGFFSQYDYDAANHIIKITDQEGREQHLTYAGETVKQYTAPDGGVTDYEFDFDDVNKQFISKVVGPETAAGRRVEDFTHNRVGQLVRKIVNGRIDEEVKNDTGARVKTLTNARGFSTRTVYNEFEQIVEMTHPDGGVQNKSYSPLNLQIIEEIGQNGVKTQYQYDARGNLLKVIEAVGLPEERVTEYEVNSLGQRISITRRGRLEVDGFLTPDSKWQFEYDALGQIEKITDPEGRIERYTYDRTGHLRRVINKRGYATSYGVDASGNLLSVSSPLERSRALEYDKVGNVIRYTDALGKQQEMTYDRMGRIETSKNPIGGLLARKYNREGLLIEHSDEDQRITLVDYDIFLRRIQETDGLGFKTQYAYSLADGSLGSLSIPTEIKYPTYIQQARLDELERPTSFGQTFRSGEGVKSVNRFKAYDKNGLLRSDTDAHKKIQTYEYNIYGELTKHTDRLGNLTLADYDVRGNMIRLTDAKGNVHRFEFDRNNRLRKEIRPLGQIIDYKYDEEGNLVERLEPNGGKSIYIYDAANRMQEVTRHKPSSVLERATTYNYDKNDKLKGWSDTVSHGAVNQNSSATISYDDAGRKISEVVSYPTPNGSSFVMGFSYGYSFAGKKTSLTWPTGDILEYAYTQNGSLASVSIPNEGILSYRHYDWAEPTEIVMPGGVQRDVIYDGLLRPISLKVKTPGQINIISLENTFGLEGELMTRSRVDTALGLSGSETSAFVYDDELRLRKSTTVAGSANSSVEEYRLDGVGNRTEYSGTNGLLTYDENNRLLQRGSGPGSSTYQYDASGNVIQRTDFSGAVIRYEYDVDSRLVRISDGSNQTISRYGYDPLNRRIWKEQFRDQSNQLLPHGRRTYYLYADEGLIAEATQKINLGLDDVTLAVDEPQVSTMYAYKPDTSYNEAPLLIKTLSANGSPIFGYFHLDHLGTPIQVTEKSGKVIWSAKYEAFGKAVITTPANEGLAIVSNLRFPGQYEDDESGLYYNFNRYYDPATGRYIQSDPIGIDGGLNLYLYGAANPGLNVDPDGLRFRNVQPGGNAYNRRQWNRHGPKPFSVPSGPNNIEETAGYFDDNGDFVCTRWKCPQNPHMCTPKDIKTPQDWAPAATDPKDPPSGCYCDTPGYEKKYGPKPPGMDEYTTWSNSWREFNEGGHRKRFFGR